MKQNYLSFDEPEDFNNLPEPDIYYNEKLQRLSRPKFNNFGLQDDIHSYILENFPEYYHPDITNPKQEKIEHMDKLFNDFSQIESNKHQHNLKWAIKKATDEFTYDQLKKAHKQNDCFGAFDEVVQVLRNDSKTKINKLSKRFSYLSTIVSLLDIVVSVALILIVTFLSHLGDKVFSTVLISTLFIGFVALSKVSLDRFAIMPLIDNYGWRLFHKSIAFAREESIRINAIYCVLMESIARNEPVETRYSIINKQKDKIFLNRGNSTNVNTNLPANMTNYSY